jgi:hypothetical protein
MVLSIVSVGASYFYYDGKISEIQDALLDKKFLLPPTDAEVDKWNEDQYQLEVQVKERELQYIKNRQEVPYDNEFPLIDHYSAYPSGHNPPHDVLNNHLQELKSERNQLTYIFLIISLLVTLGLWTISVREKRNNTRRRL